MAHENRDGASMVLIRGASLWMLAALLLAWSLVGIFNDIGFVKSIFSGSYTRVLQAHLDFLIMTSLILGFHASKVSLPWHVNWAMVIGAFTNSSLFMLFAIFPAIDPVSEHFVPGGAGSGLFNVYMYTSLIITSYGFGKGAVLVLKASFAG
jgi:hypothetical protein